MNRFDRDMQHAAAHLVREPLPDGVLDDALDAVATGRGRWRTLAGVAVVAALVLGIGLGQLLVLSPDERLTPSPTQSAASFRPETARPEATPEEPAEAVVATVEEDDIGVTLELDHGQVSLGDRVWALVTIENRGVDNLYWGHSSTCLFAAGAAAHPEQPEPLAYGRRDWPGTAGILKNVAVFIPDPDLERGYGFTPEVWVDREGNFGCTSDFVTSEVSPGETLTYRAAWDVVGPHRMPAPSGGYSVVATFRYIGRGPSPPDAGAEELPTVSVEVPFSVQGPRVDYLSPGEAVDAALADTDFAARLAGLPQERWAGAPLEFQEGDWVLRLDVRDPNQSLVAVIDAVSGMVREVSLIPRMDP